MATAFKINDQKMSSEDSQIASLHAKLLAMVEKQAVLEDSLEGSKQELKTAKTHAA